MEGSVIGGMPGGFWGEGAEADPPGCAVLWANNLRSAAARPVGLPLIASVISDNSLRLHSPTQEVMFQIHIVASMNIRIMSHSTT